MADENSCGSSIFNLTQSEDSVLTTGIPDKFEELLGNTQKILDDSPKSEKLTLSKINLQETDTDTSTYDTPIQGGKIPFSDMKSEDSSVMKELENSEKSLKTVGKVDISNPASPVHQNEHSTSTMGFSVCGSEKNSATSGQITSGEVSLTTDKISMATDDVSMGLALSENSNSNSTLGSSGKSQTKLAATDKDLFGDFSDSGSSGKSNSKSTGSDSSNSKGKRNSLGTGWFSHLSIHDVHLMVRYTLLKLERHADL